MDFVRKIKFFLFVFMSLLFGAVGQRTAELIDVQIGSSGFLPPPNAGSMSFNGPAIQMGVEEIRRLYGDKFNFTLTLLANREATNCLEFREYTDFAVSEWFYGLDSSTNVAALIQPGKK